MNEGVLHHFGQERGCVGIEEGALLQSIPPNGPTHRRACLALMRVVAHLAESSVAAAPCRSEKLARRTGTPLVQARTQAQEAARRPSRQSIMRERFSICGCARRPTTTVSDLSPSASEENDATLDCQALVACDALEGLSDANGEPTLLIHIARGCAGGTPGAAG
eukprot:CAMPEP_0171097730 /NCGR_PEP_ID=MMETSP0766_2-20121228/47713_1 /TAXON_ID=439317 /ORGANISM="Gambierdiscus australes, Strain CAWD 149" /LENGTH=163 /DNA_ID=CAMNT_0011556971 /DNA_START=187 /DNA_END=679 /DNA_ORIENTATION=-